MDAKVTVNAISKKFANVGSTQGTLALDATSFSIADGEIVCLLGPSGCGKSTVLRIIAGFESASAGEILVDGKKVQRPGPDRGVVFQEQALFPWLTIRQNIMSGPKFRSLNLAAFEQKTLEFLRIIGLEDFADHYPHMLSGGMKQRVAIARALINSPAVLLMDEPFGALDAQTRAQMQEWLLELWHLEKRAILFITHDVDEAIFLADRILLMSARPGRVAQTWNVNVARPRHDGSRTHIAFMELKRDILAALRANAQLEPQ